MKHSDYYSLLAILCLVRARCDPECEVMDSSLARKRVSEVLEHYRFCGFGAYEESMTPELLGYGEMKYRVKFSIQLFRSIDYYNVVIGMRSLDHYWFCNIERISPHTEEYERFTFEELC